MDEHNLGDQARQGVQSPSTTSSSSSSSNSNQSANNGNSVVPCNLVNPAVVNPTEGLPPHVQEQLRRQIQAQQFLRLQQQQMMMHVRPPTGMVPMPMAGGMVPPRMPPQMQAGMVRPPSLPSSMGGPAQPAMSSGIPAHRLEMLSRVIPYHGGMDENGFLQSLQQFLSVVGLPLKKPPVINGKQISLLQLFRTVASFGGFQKVSDTRRWPAVSASLGLPPGHIDCLASLHSMYGTLLYPYEQFMLSKVPADRIQWPSAVTRAFASAGPTPTASAPSSAAVPPPGPSRLTSVLQKAPSSGSIQGSASSLSGPSLKPANAGQIPLEAIGVQQWKNAHSVGNPHAALKRGRYMLSELVLFMESGQDHLVRFALNILQLVSLDSNFFPQDSRSFTKLIDLVLDVCEAPRSTSVVSTWTLARRATNRSERIELDQDFELPELISNIIRSFSLRMECKPAIEKSLASRSSVIISWIAQSSSMELRKNAFMILSELSPKIRFAPSNLNSLFKLMELDICELNDLILKSSQRSFLVWPFCPVDADSMKKHIVNMIQNCTNFYKLIPPVAYVELQSLYIVLLQLTLGEESGKKNGTYLSGLKDLGAQLVQLSSLVLQPILKIMSLIHELLQMEEFRRSPDYAKWFQKILHNTTFGLPDGGYCELVCLCVKTLVAVLDKSSTESLLDQSGLATVVQISISAIRGIWECTEPSAPIKFERPVAAGDISSRKGRTVSVIHTDKSPLLWQAFSSACSHPYQLYLVLTKMLDDLVGKAPEAMAKKLDLNRVLCWSCGEGLQCALSRDILCTAELTSLYGRLLECSLSSLSLQ